MKHGKRDDLAAVYRPDLGCYLRPHPTLGEGYWLVVGLDENLQDRMVDDHGREMRIEASSA